MIVLFVWGVQWPVCLAGSPKLELVLTSATQAADHEDMFLARSSEAEFDVLCGVMWLADCL